MLLLPLSILTVVIWLGLIFCHGRFWQAGPVLAPVPGLRLDAATCPDVCVVVPARDEAPSVAACIGSLLAQDYPGTLRVVLVDDNSTDGTGRLARAVPDPHRRLTVVTGKARPAGWSGKLWAVAQGVARARELAPDSSGFVLLTDADITHDPRHVSTLVAKAQAGGLDQVSEMVELNCASPAERMLVPAFVFFFALLYPFASVNNPRSRVAGAAGGTVLVRWRALARIGGIESLRGALIDDCTLAAHVKHSGGRIYLGHSCLARSIRPYPHPSDIWRMVARTAYVQLGYSPFLLVGTVIGMVLVWMLPMQLALFAHGSPCLLGAGAWVLSMASYTPTLRRFGLSPAWALLLPVIAGFYTLATIGSALDHHRGRGVVWKSRAYTEPDGAISTHMRSEGAATVMNRTMGDDVG
ncbi:glycosyltransferase [Komagataeibacter sucrofermentans]|uniref:Glycosyl transferase n=1 Tax=Komagataeibacter sucrofermentans TaxID=1053551 RepID=A0A318QQI4_9PROT|nr:glycosyltransferase [Komagataeibacter sucrofermentans]PYD79631.1 glycosyl transferase [Komagataeibacter sucrofermentans]GBQ49788.1 glycosyltransferase [Komagataeibacter sucrofermentans DSM 15973]